MTSSPEAIPQTQYAIEIVGKDEMVLDRAKPVPSIGPTQVLLRTEACGICFSDTKLLHAFADHPRKAPIVSGLSAEELASIPTYVPGDAPTVPGHEPILRVVAVGEQVRHVAVGDRVLVQADWRHLPTPASNGAFGYGFEGALQEYTVVDERITFHDGENYLIDVSEGPSAAAVGLIEPWATVENSYAWRERRTRLAGGRLLVVADAGRALPDLTGGPAPGEVVFVGTDGAGSGLTGEVRALADVADRTYDDVYYVGTDPAVVETLVEKLRNRGHLVVVLGGGRLGRPVKVDVGRIHYDFIRLLGTVGDDPAEAEAAIPEVTDVRDGDRMLVLGAAGPMGLMHTMRATVLGRSGLVVEAADVSDERLATLRGVVGPVAEKRGVDVRMLNSANSPLGEGYTYFTCMVPVPALLAAGLAACGEGAIVNLFAGMPAGTVGELDLDDLIAKRIFLFGTSGSDLVDMRTVLRKIEAGDYDTSVSLDAVCGMAGVRDAFDAVINRTSGGKIMVYPALHDLGLVRLVDLPTALPSVAALLDHGVWTKAAEEELHRVAG